MSQKDQNWQQLGDRLSGFQAAGDPQADFAQFQQLLQNQKLVNKAWWQRPYFWLNTFLIMSLIAAVIIGFSLLSNSAGSEALSSQLPLDAAGQTTTTELPTSTIDSPSSSSTEPTEVETSLETTASRSTTATTTASTAASAEAGASSTMNTGTATAASHAATGSAVSTTATAATTRQTQADNASANGGQPTTPQPFTPATTTSNSSAENNSDGSTTAATDQELSLSPTSNAQQNQTKPSTTNQRLNQIPDRSILPLDIPQQLPEPTASPMELTDPFRRENTNFLMQAHLGLSFHLPSFSQLNFDAGAYAAFSAHYRLNRLWEVGGRVGVALHSLNIPEQAPAISSVDRSVSWNMPNGFFHESRWTAELNSVNIISLAATGRYAVNGRLRASFGLQLARLVATSDWQRTIRGNISNIDPFRDLTEYPIRRNNWSFLLGLDYRISEQLGLEIMATPSFQDITPNEYDDAQHTSTSIALGLSIRL